VTAVVGREVEKREIGRLGQHYSRAGKTLYRQFAPALHKLCRVWVTGRVPADWRDGIIISLYKGKGRRPNAKAADQSPSFQSPTRFMPIFYWRQSNLSSSKMDGSKDAVLGIRLLSDLHRDFSWPLYVAYVDLIWRAPVLLWVFTSHGQRPRCRIYGPQ